MYSLAFGDFLDYMDTKVVVGVPSLYFHSGTIYDAFKLHEAEPRLWMMSHFFLFFLQTLFVYFCSH